MKEVHWEVWDTPRYFLALHECPLQYVGVYNSTMHCKKQVCFIFITYRYSYSFKDVGRMSLVLHVCTRKWCSSEALSNYTELGLTNCSTHNLADILKYWVQSTSLKQFQFHCYGYLLVQWRLLSWAKHHNLACSSLLYADI